MSNHPIVVGFVVCVVVAALLGVATYHAAMAWRRWREGEAPADPLADPFIETVTATTEAFKRLGEAITNSRDWTAGEKYEWWREGVPLVDGRRCADRILGPRPTDNRPYDWGQEASK